MALVGLALIVLTGAAVRLTDSGLGCPDWPQCYGAGSHPPLESHAIIESANRIVTGLLGVAVIAAAVLAFFRRPYRRHLAIFGVLLPLGVIAQAILGALVVKYDLRPELVMGHFILSMMLLDAGLRAVLVLALRALGPAALARPQGRLGGARPGAARAADDPRRDRRHRLGPARGRVRRPVRQALHLRGRRTRSNGWSSATPCSPPSTASPRSGSGSTCGGRAATGGR